MFELTYSFKRGRLLVEVGVSLPLPSELREVSCHALVDTGTTHTLIAPSLADLNRLKAVD